MNLFLAILQMSLVRIELLKANLIFCIFFSLSVFAAPTWLEAPFLNQSDTMKSSSIFFIVHPTETFDSNKVAKNGINEWINLAKRLKNPIIYAVDQLGSEALDGYYVSDKPDRILKSWRGEHKLRLEADRVYFGGGFFNRCLAQAIRDVIIYANPKKMPELVLLSDAIYHARPYKTNNGHNSKPTLLKNEFKRLSNVQMLDFLENNLLQFGELGTQSESGRSVKLNAYSFQIYRDGQYIGKIGEGLRSVRMNFLNTGKSAKAGQELLIEEPKLKTKRH
jgi:hypothetical protein